MPLSLYQYCFFAAVISAKSNWFACLQLIQKVNHRPPCTLFCSLTKSNMTWALWAIRLKFGVTPRQRWYLSFHPINQWKNYICSKTHNSLFCTGHTEPCTCFRVLRAYCRWTNDTNSVAISIASWFYCQWNRIQWHTGYYRLQWLTGPWRHTSTTTTIMQRRDGAWIAINADSERDITMMLGFHPMPELSKQSKPNSPASPKPSWFNRIASLYNSLVKCMPGFHRHTRLF